MVNFSVFNMSDLSINIQGTSTMIIFWRLKLDFNNYFYQSFSICNHHMDESSCTKNNIYANKTHHASNLM